MVVKKSIAIIPARGGSKRIPKKNIMDFFEKPIIAYTIEAAINSKKFDRVLVSTDSPEIAEISKNFGAEVPFLRTENADDQTTVSEAVLFALDQAEAHYREKYDCVAQLMANCPIRDENDIIKAYDNFMENDYDSQLTCFKFGFMNPWWAFKLNKDFSDTKLIEQDINIRSQDLEELYCPTGAMWIAKSEQLRKYKSFYTGSQKYFEIDWKSAVDIDNYEDVELAKAVYLIKNGM
jgi:N-acylneuraminate cytidylyltransferase